VKETVGRSVAAVLGSIVLMSLNIPAPDSGWFSISSA